MAPPTLQADAALSLQADPVLCHCFRVTESTIDNCVTLLGASNLQEVRAACGAGGGCMSCRRRIQCMIDNHSASGQNANVR